MKGVRGGRFSVHAPGDSVRCYQIDSTEPADYYRAKVDEVQREWNALEVRALEIYNAGEPGPVAGRAIIARLVASGAQMMLELDEAADIRIGRKLQDTAAGMNVSEALIWCLQHHHVNATFRRACWHTLRAVYMNTPSVWSRAGLRIAMFFVGLAIGPRLPLDIVEDE